MIVDTSAMIAILKREPEAERLLAAILSADEDLLTSAGTAIELAIVGARSVPAISADELSVFLSRAGIRIAPVDEAQVRIAWTAFATYGRGRHPAGLNYGDCFAYALSRQTGRPLLFKGEDFAMTDVAVATY